MTDISHEQQEAFDRAAIADAHQSASPEQVELLESDPSRWLETLGFLIQDVEAQLSEKRDEEGDDVATWRQRAGNLRRALVRRRVVAKAAVRANHDSTEKFRAAIKQHYQSCVDEEIEPTDYDYVLWATVGIKPSLEEGTAA